MQLATLGGASIGIGWPHPSEAHVQLMSTSAVRDGESRFGRGVAIVRCSAEERERLRRLLDEFDPAVDVFSLRERPPDVVELEIQFDVAAGPDPASLLRRRLPGLEG